MKKETNKTVVEQLVEKIEHYSNYTIRIPIDAVEQFKEMEKEQIMNAYDIGWSNGNKGQDLNDLYYNETFNTK